MEETPHDDQPSVKKRRGRKKSKACTCHKKEKPTEIEIGQILRAMGAPLAEDEPLVLPESDGPLLLIKQNLYDTERDQVVLATQIVRLTGYNKPEKSSARTIVHFTDGRVIFTNELPANLMVRWQKALNRALNLSPAAANEILAPLRAVHFN